MDMNSMEQTPQQRATLIEGLVGDKWRSLYLTSPSFHTQIDTVVGLLPPWIDALAKDAQKQDADLQIAMKTMGWLK